MKTFFNLDIFKLAALLLPPRVRTPHLLSWLGAAMLPLQLIHVTFSRYREDAAYRIQHNGQVCYLQAALNDALDSIQRRIRIQEVSRTEPVVFHPEIDGKPVVFTEEVEHLFFPASSFGANGVDFSVSVPPDIFVVSSISSQRSEKEVKARGILNAYKLASKRYTILNKKI